MTTQCSAPTCADMLCQAVQAYNALLTSSTEVVKVKSLDHETEYHRRDAEKLLDHIRRLHLRCPSEASAAVLGIPMRRAARGVRYGGNSGCC